MTRTTRSRLATRLVVCLTFLGAADAQDKSARPSEPRDPAATALPLFPNGRPEAGGPSCPGVDLTAALPCDGMWRIDATMGIPTATNSGAPAASCWAGDPTQNDIWYRWTNTSPATVAFVATTDDPVNVPGDSQIAVYASCVATELACSEDLDPTATRLLSDTCSFDVAPGQTIHIQFDGWNGDRNFNAGLFLCEPVPSVDGDSCGNAIDLGTLSPRVMPPYTVTDLPVPCGYSDYNLIEPNFSNVLDEGETCFSFTAAADGWIQIAAAPVSNNARVILSSDGGATFAISRQCWSNGTGPYDTSPQHGATVTAGQSYCFCIDSGVVPVVDRGDLWDMEMYFWPLTTATNLGCASSQPISLCGGPVTFTGLSTAGAGNGPGVPVDQGCGVGFWSICSGHGSDLSYSLEFTQQMRDCGCTGFRVTQASPELGTIARVCDSAIQIARSCPVNVATCVATVDNTEPGMNEVATVNPAAVGTTYTIQPDGYMTSACPNFDLTVELLGCTPMCAVCTVVEPDVVLAACPFVDACMGTSDGEIDPDDDVTYTLTFRNQGASTAVAFSADIVLLAGATLISGGTVPAVDIPVGMSVTHDLVVRIVGQCGDPVDIDVVNMRSDGGLYTYSPNLIGCDQQIEPPGPTCAPCACMPVPPTGVVGNALRAVKLTADDLRLSWVGHMVTPPNFAPFKTPVKTEVVETPMGIGDETALGITTATSLDELGVVQTMPTELYYQILAADSCDGVVFP